MGCAVAVVGGGVGGLFVGYRLAPLLGRRLCVIDDRAQVGGKVRGRGLSCGWLCRLTVPAR